MPRKQKLHHFIYRTTCNRSGNYYYGMHSTDNLDDGYLGSGTKISRSIKKYGKENHIIEKIEFFENREKLKEREAKIVNEDLLQDPSCMNLITGGGGGFHTKVQRDNFFENGKRTRWGSTYNHNLLKELWKDDEWSAPIRKKRSERLKGNTIWLGRKHSEISKQKNREADRTGIKNSQYGTCWITNEKESKKIHKGDLIPEGWRLGRTLKQTKL